VAATSGARTHVELLGCATVPNLCPRTDVFSGLTRSTPVAARLPADGEVLRTGHDEIETLARSGQARGADRGRNPGRLCPPGA
jgi:hypothetical protein